MNHIKQLSRLAILGSFLFASSTFASSPITLNFQNCTNQNVNVSWDAYNFNFDGDIGKDQSKHGSFVLPNGSTTKILMVYIDTLSEGNLTAHLSGGVVADFKIEENMSILGGVDYINASDKLIFDKNSNNVIRITASNTIKIGC